MTDRFSDLRGVAETLGVDAVALVPGPNFTRSVGQAFMSHERPFVLVVPKSGAPAAIVPNLELGSWDQVGFDGKTYDWRDQVGYQPAFDALGADMKLTSLAVEGQVMRVFVHHALIAAMPGLTILDGEKAISGLRAIKTGDEVAAMRAAIEISERALEQVLARVKIGQTEAEIEAMLIQAMFAEGADDLAFTPIVAAGDNSARPHAHARADYQVQAGDALLFDFGAKKHGFCADITRTVFVGHASDEGQAVYDTVLRANLAGHAMTRAGVTAHDIDDAVTSVLEASPYAARIRTKTGHGLGREVHEAPYIVRGNTEVMQAGMVYTNEPGLYELGNFGVRIEDDVLITQEGCDSLTSFPKELMIVGRA